MTAFAVKEGFQESMPDLLWSAGKGIPSMLGQDAHAVASTPLPYPTALRSRKLKLFQCWLEVMPNG